MCLQSQEVFKQKLKVFVEGNVIDFNYMRNNTPFVNFVNDPKSSDVHIIITKQKTGGGGFLFTLEYNSAEFPNIPKIKLSCNTISFDTDIIIKEKLVKTFHSGLMPFINEKDGMQGLKIVSINDSWSHNPETSEIEVDDPWKLWVFRLGADIGFKGEEKERNFEYSFSTRITKITDSWKIISDYDFQKSKEIIEKDNGEIIKSIKTNQGINSKLIFSINPHWSYGIFLDGSQSTYRNTKMNVRITPAIQYNFYKWKESDRKEFTISYDIGPNYNEYYETTIFGMMNEWLWQESVEIRYNKLETWGEINFKLEGGHYFPGLDNYYGKIRLDLGIRISKGLSVYFRTEAESVHNQIYLPNSELSDEELLLDIVKRPSTIEYNGKIGFRFQFGSVYNNIVNERM